MKIVLWTTLALCAVTVGVNAPILHAQTIQVNKENRTISVTATDKVMALADAASVHIGFITYGADSNAAYASGSRLSNAIHKALTGAGVPNDAIESESQNLAPVQEYQIDKLTPAEKAARQFQLTQSWTVRTNAADAARILDLAVKAGANQSGQIEWTLKDPNIPEAEAAAKALQRARSVAAGMARGLDAKLGILLYASNEIEAQPIRPMMRAMAAPSGGMQKVEPLAINPRQIEKVATVHAIFAIE